MNKTLSVALRYQDYPLYWVCLKHNCKTFNFISESTEIADLCGFDEFTSRDSVTVMHEKFTWSNIVAEIGLFKSTSEARKAGWNIPIENGYSEAVFFAKYGNPLFVFILK